MLVRCLNSERLFNVSTSSGGKTAVLNEWGCVCLTLLFIWMQPQNVVLSESTRSPVPWPIDTGEHWLWANSLTHTERITLLLHLYISSQQASTVDYGNSSDIFFITASTTSSQIIYMIHEWLKLIEKKLMSWKCAVIQIWGTWLEAFFPSYLFAMSLFYEIKCLFSSLCEIRLLSLQKGCTGSLSPWLQLHMLPEGGDKTANCIV